MKSYEDQYYLLLKNPFRNDSSSLKATLNTSRRDFRTKKLDYGGGPVFFTLNGEVSAFDQKKIQFSGIFPVVSSDVAKLFMPYKITSFQLFPAVIIDQNDKWHEDFFYFNLYDELDCIDFEKSKIRNYDPSDYDHEVIEYKFNKDILDAIDVDNRLIILPEGVFGGSLIFHENIVEDMKKFIYNNSLSFYKLSEYKLGDEYKV
ncbi:DUF1629 domain-containing protein [Vibrio neptunius]|uniref:imm11 family protein n=1 Tax=Vibrio neptunius TaxID=170651 RepID=UPI00331453BC